MDQGIFKLNYETWKCTVEMYKNIDIRSLESYLQWYPFSKLREEDWDILESEEFYESNIYNGAFSELKKQMLVTNNYIQKSDSSFRNATLVSPTLYLILQAVGYDISSKYKDSRGVGVSVYYGGNYNNDMPIYKESYDSFFKEINLGKEKYEYYIKTDIKSFYDNIDLNVLCDRIQSGCNKHEKLIDQDYIYLIKELLCYTGDGLFPLVENSICSSYLSTVVYLDDVDVKLCEYIDNISAIDDYHIYRYVDDMYILFNSDLNDKRLQEECNEILNKYSSILLDSRLGLNSKKYSFNKCTFLDCELKKSLYDEYYCGIKHSIGELFEGSLYEFLEDIYNELMNHSIDIDKYNRMIEKHFIKEGVEFTAGEVYNYFVYENDEELHSEKTSKLLKKILESSLSFISIDAKRLMTMMLRTQNSEVIKKSLNRLFVRDRQDKWNRQDSVVAITYLIQSGFRHIDLLDVLYKREKALYIYYNDFCKYSFLCSYQKMDYQRIRKAIGIDAKTYYLYFLYLCERKKKNITVAYAYYKTYFDGISADIAFTLGIMRKNNKPSYDTYYKAPALKELYKDIDNSKELIERAASMRNNNPLCHTSSRLINSNYYDDIVELIENLENLIIKKLQNSIKL